ncbi:MAG: ribosome small subunit-dependent GTPase A [Bacteroidales bacterium]|nr:ribosome small subunit-dependent GTPase A [Bacteroidales bacterium]
MKEGVVIKASGSLCMVKADDGLIVPCRLKGRLRLDETKSTSPVAVGDKVVFEFDSASQEGVIAEILPRRNYIVRKATNLSKQSHILAANIDQAILLVTVNYPVTTTDFIDRFLTSAEAYNIPVILLFNKIDRYDARHIRRMEELMDVYEKIGYPTLALSAKKQDDFEEIKKLFMNKTTLIAGHSGVGKSTLINRLEPGLRLRTREISTAHNTGTHTTTFAEMYPFPFGGYVIDTPGIRGFGLHDTGKEELYHCFREIYAASPGCQFHNCTHIHEPDCAVKAAVAEGGIARSRYDSYLNIYNNNDDKYR